MKTRDEIFQLVSQELESLFELSADQITWDARLYEELDLDSIDAVDLVVRLQEISKKRITPDQFKAVATVGDIVEAVESLLNE